MQQPNVNIMLPVFNGLPYLKASIESIRRQTYSNWQCIICDDGSTDGTWDYLQTLCDDSRFVLLQNAQNMGRGFTRQRILEACTAPYICMLDSGDLMHPERLTKQVAFLESHPELSLVSTAMLCYGTETDIITFQGSTQDTICKFDGYHACNFAPTMFRRITDSIRFKSELRFCEDQHFLRNYLSRYPDYAVMSEPLYYYSVFDSASKRKMRRDYLQDMHTFMSDKQWYPATICLLKALYATLFFPFMSIERIIIKRSSPAKEEQIKEFNLYARPLL